MGILHNKTFLFSSKLGLTEMMPRSEKCLQVKSEMKTGLKNSQQVNSIFIASALRSKKSD